MLQNSQKSVLDEENLLSALGACGRFSCSQTSTKTEERAGKGNFKSEGCEDRKETRTNKLEKWISSFVITPTKNILYTGHWINGPYKYMPKNKALLQTCFHNINQKIVDMSIRYLFLRTRQISMNKLIYVAQWNGVADYYYDVHNSVRVLEELIQEISEE